MTALPLDTFVCTSRIIAPRPSTHFLAPRRLRPFFAPSLSAHFLAPRPSFHHLLTSSSTHLFIPGSPRQSSVLPHMRTAGRPATPALYNPDPTLVHTCSHLRVRHAVLHVLLFQVLKDNDRIRLTHSYRHRVKGEGTLAHTIRHPRRNSSDMLNVRCHGSDASVRCSASSFSRT